MAEPFPVVPGLPVFGADGGPLGPVEAVDGAGITVGGRHVPAGALARVTPQGVHLLEPAAAYGPAAPGAADEAPALFAFTLPVLPEQADALRAFAAAVQGERSAAFAALRRRMGIAREAWWYRPEAGALIVAFAAPDPAAAFAAFAGADDPFARWVKGQLRAITGLDPLAQPTRGPTQEPLLAWPTPGADDGEEA